MTAHCFEQVKNLLVILLTLNKLRLSGYLTTLDRLSCFLDDCFSCQKLRQNSRGRNWIPEHFLATTSCHWHYTLTSETCEGLHQLWALPRHETFFFLSFECLGIHFFNLHSHVACRMPCHARGHSHSCIRKQMISLGMAIILSIYLCSHT